MGQLVRQNHRGLGRRPAQRGTAILVIASLFALVGCGSDGDSVSSALTTVATADSDPTDTAVTGTTEVIAITPELIAAAQAEGKLSFRYSAQQLITDALTAEFTSEYGITVDSDRRVGAAGTEQFATEERAGSHVVDVFLSTDGAGYVDLINEGLLANYTVEGIDETVPAAARYDGWGYVPYWQTVVIGYNPDRISTEEATRLFKDWNGLLDPSLSDGRIGIVAPRGATQGFMLNWMWKDLPQFGPDYVKKLRAQNPLVFEGSAPAREALTSGEISVYATEVESSVAAEWAAGTDLRWAVPDITPQWGAFIHGISKNAPHPNAARLFVAWLFSDAGTKAMQAVGLSPTRLDAGTNPPYLDKLTATDWFQGFVTDDRTWTPPSREEWYAQQKDLTKEFEDAWDIQS